MSEYALIIIIHQIIFQSLFFAKNILLRRKLGTTIRGRNREADLSIGFFAVFIITSFLLSLFSNSAGTINLLANNTASTFALVLLAINLLIGSASLIGLKDSWRVGILHNQQTDLIETGIYQFSRNPYFLSYLLMFAAYTLLLQNVILLVMSLFGFALIHAMILKEEEYLSVLHGDKYVHYKERVPRYLLF